MKFDPGVQWTTVEQSVAPFQYGKGVDIRAVDIRKEGSDINCRLV